jgi:hypothetical protein
MRKALVLIEFALVTIIKIVNIINYNITNAFISFTCMPFSINFMRIHIKFKTFLVVIKNK